MTCAGTANVDKQHGGVPCRAPGRPLGEQRLRIANGVGRAGDLFGLREHDDRSVRGGLHGGDQLLGVGTGSLAERVRRVDDMG